MEVLSNFYIKGYVPQEKLSGMNAEINTAKASPKYAYNKTGCFSPSINLLSLSVILISFSATRFIFIFTFKESSSLNVSGHALWQ